MEQGFAATRIQQVAERAGVSKGTVYLYFESKEVLLEAVVRESMGPVIDRGEEMFGDGTRSAADLIRSLLLFWWSAFEEKKATGLPKLIYAEGANYPQIVEIYMQGVWRTRRLFERVIEYGVERGEFRPVDAPTVVRLLLGQVIFAMIYKHSLARFEPAAADPKQFLQVLCDLYFGGLLARDGALAGG